MKDLNNRIFDAFDNIHAEEQLKMHTRSYILQKPVKKRMHFAGYAVASLLCLLMLTGFGSYRVYMKPVAAISIDINPSMEWEVNRFDRVISVTYYNRDARNAASHLNLMHKKYDDAMDLLLTSQEMSGYLAEDALIDISVTSDNETKRAEMQARAVQCAGKYCNQVSHHTGNTEDMDAAHEAGLSFGKYQAFLTLQELDPGITVEDVQGMCMREIQTMIEDYSSGSASGYTDSAADTDQTIDNNSNNSNNDNTDLTNNNYSGNNGGYGHGDRHHMGHGHN